MHKSEHLPIDVPEPTERCCYRCGETRPIGMFYVDAERRQTERRGRRSPVRIPCRVCTQATNEAARKPRQDYINKVKLASGCTDCGLIDLEHLEIYDFDHLPGQTKARGVAAMLTSGTFEDLLAEIAKCEVVCANCHRIRTRRRPAATFGKSWSAGR